MSAQPIEGAPAVPPRPLARERRTARVVPLRDLRNPGAVVKELVESGEAARVTDRGRVVAWLVPAAPEDQLRQELVAGGVLRLGRSSSLAGRTAQPAAEAGRPLSEVLHELRGEERA
ncbi:hypothetical protein ACIA8O_34820 [Kitasatospora sp. NPDC051853]|uniref:hypothetical protein n=1 Tax=Kitasatospora sp. NPDC051853 TaxID=3364058 RepID=UPI00379B1E56